MQYIVLLTAFCVLVLIIGLYCVSKHYKTKEILRVHEREKNRTNVFTSSNQWMSISLSQFHQSDSVRHLIELMGKGENTLMSIIPEYFKKIHYFDSYTLLKLSADSHNGIFKLSEEDTIAMKRVITISSIIHNFKVPNNLWCFDEYVVQVTVQYILSTELKSVDLKEYSAITYPIPSIYECNEFKKVMNNIHTGCKLLAKSGGNNKAPNIHRLSVVIANEFPKVWVDLNENIVNLKRLMTICYMVNGLDVPNDYLIMDYNVYKFITAPNSFMKKKKHLSLVREKHV